MPDVAAKGRAERKAVVLPQRPGEDSGLVWSAEFRWIQNDHRDLNAEEEQSTSH